MAPLACLATDQSAGWLFRPDRHSGSSSTSDSDVLFGMNPHHTYIEVSASHRSQKHERIVDTGFNTYIYIYIKAL